MPNCMIIIQLTEEQFKGLLEEAIRKASITNHQEPSPPPDELLTAVQTADFLSLELSTIYSLVNQKAIPYMKPNGKRLYFSKQELIGWIKSGRKKTVSEMASDATNYLRKSPKRKEKK